MKTNKFLLILPGFFLLPIMVSSTPINSLFYYTIQTSNDNYSDSDSHKAFAPTTNAKTNYTKSFTVTIPKGSANPEIDITKLGPRQWYLPREIIVHTNDTITWINNDTEAHTVTSGTGAGIESLQNNKRGIPNGIFDIGLFKPSQSWTHTFTTPGTYNYFCTIHPWMDGAVTVQGKAQNIPNYPVDVSGKRIDSLPVYQFTHKQLTIGFIIMVSYRKEIETSLLSSFSIHCLLLCKLKD